MARTAKITLDGVDYTIRAFNIGELEIIQRAGSDAWTVLKTALGRADPKVDHPDLIEPTPEELKVAFETIMTLAGLQKPDASPPAGAGAP
jgi:hypothetical protein